MGTVNPQQMAIFHSYLIVYQRVPSRPFGFRKHDTAVLDTKIGFREDLQETQKYEPNRFIDPQSWGIAVNFPQ